MKQSGSFFRTQKQSSGNSWIIQSMS